MRALRQLDETNMYKTLRLTRQKTRKHCSVGGEREAAASVVRAAILGHMRSSFTSMSAAVRSLLSAGASAH